MFEEPLVFLPVEQWDKLKAVFKRKWPQGISGYATLDIEEQILKNGADYGFKVFVPYGDVTNGLVGMNVKGSFNEIVILSINDDTTDLVKALRHTKLIDWTRPLQLPFAPQRIVNLFKSVMLEKNVTFTNIATTLKMMHHILMSRKLPPGLSFRLLTDEYAEISNDTWPHKYPRSIWYYHLLIKAKLGYGLFKDDELVAWCYVRETGALGHLYTLDQYRRRGFGELVVKLISNQLRKEGKIVFAFCIVANDSARRLYQKLNFSLTEEVHWCGVKPIVK